MEVKRLYNRERSFMVFASIMFISIAVTAVVLISSIKHDSFKENLIKGNYDSLYNCIENADFSREVFYAYMDYNYGKDKKIVSIKHSSNAIEYIVKGSQEEKVIKLYKKNRRYFWAFDDYIYGWEIKVPMDAEVMVEDMQFLNENGIVRITRIPFSVYEITIEAKNCEKFKSRMLVGQNISVRMKPSAYVIKRCKRSILEYLSFKELPIKEDLDTKCVDKTSGLYREVIDEAAWLKANGYLISKKIISMEIFDEFMDIYGIVYVTVKENWNIEVSNEGRIEAKNEIDMNTYRINPSGNFMIEEVKTANKGI